MLPLLLIHPLSYWTIVGAYTVQGEKNDTRYDGRSPCCTEPFTGLYKKALIFYVIFLSIILLWPFNFTFFEKKNHVKWSETSPGLHFIGEGQVISPSFSKPFYENLINGKGFSLEVWIYSANNNQHGPARIVSYSLNPSYRNFTLGQEGSALIIRLRTENTNLNGTEPMLIVEHVFTHSNRFILSSATTLRAKCVCKREYKDDIDCP